MSTAIYLPESLEFQADNEDTMNEIFSYITDSPAKQKFGELIQTMPDRQLAIRLEEHALDMVIHAIEQMAHLAQLSQQPAAGNSRKANQ